MMSAEAGLEGNNYESNDNISDNLGDEQWSVIVKNIEDCNYLEFAFGSELHNSSQEWVIFYFIKFIYNIKYLLNLI